MCEASDKSCKAPLFDCGFLSHGASGDELRLPDANSPQDTSDVILQDLARADLFTGESTAFCSCGACCDCKLDSEKAVPEFCSSGEHVEVQAVPASDYSLCALLSKFGEQAPESEKTDGCCKDMKSSQAKSKIPQKALAHHLMLKQVYRLLVPHAGTSKRPLHWSCFALS